MANYEFVYNSPNLNTKPLGAIKVMIILTRIITFYETLIAGFPISDKQSQDQIYNSTTVSLTWLYHVLMGNIMLKQPQLNWIDLDINFQTQNYSRFHLVHDDAFLGCYVVCHIMSRQLACNKRVRSASHPSLGFRSVKFMTKFSPIF